MARGRKSCAVCVDVVIFANKPGETQQSGTDTLLICDVNGSLFFFLFFTQVRPTQRSKSDGAVFIKCIVGEEKKKKVQAENMAAVVKLLKPPFEDGHKRKPSFHSSACIVGCSWAACCDECSPGDGFFFQKQVPFF